ncbi:ribonuclease H-like domain-containing protein, partial [Tanacetum coccineum]
MDDPNITMEEYIKLEEEKARRHVFYDAFTSEVTPSCEPTVSPLNNNKIDFGIPFDESDDEDYTVIYDKNSFSYKIISVNDLKTDSENDNDKVNMPSFPSYPEPIRFLVTTEIEGSKEKECEGKKNKPDLDTMSFDDLYNNFKIAEQEVKGTTSSSSSLSSQNMAFVSSPSSTNEVNTAYGVSTANTQVSPASTQVSNCYRGFEVALALLSMMTRRFFQKLGRKITINGSTAGYDKSKVECFNCHKMGYFARECRGPRNQDSRNKNQDSSRRTVNVEETSSKAMVAIDGAGFDWSYMADDEVPINMALMAFSDSEVYNDKTCSKTCLKSFKTLKTQLDDLRIEFNKSEFSLATYKIGLASVEGQLVFYKKNKVIFCKQLAVLKRDISYKDSEISMLKSKLEKLKQEKESNQLKIENFDNASKSLDKLIGSQIPDKSRKGVGFPEFESYGPKSVSEDISNEVKESPDALLVEELVLDDKLEKKTVFPTVTKIEFVRPKQLEKPVRKPVKYVEMYTSQSPRENQRNWNNQKSQQLESDFVMYNKACFVCGS